MYQKKNKINILYDNIFLLSAKACIMQRMNMNGIS